MLIVTTLELRHPVTLLVLMETDDAPLPAIHPHPLDSIRANVARLSRCVAESCPFMASAAAASPAGACDRACPGRVMSIAKAKDKQIMGLAILPAPECCQPHPQLVIESRQGLSTVHSISLSRLPTASAESLV